MEAEVENWSGAGCEDESWKREWQIGGLWKDTG